MLRHCVLEEGDLSLHLLQTCLRHRILHRGLLPVSVLPLPWLLSHQPAGHPMVETAQHPLHMRHQEPCLLPVYQHRFHHRQVNMSRCMGIRSLPSQYPIQPRPLLPGASEVAHHCWPVVILCHKNSPQILEVVDLLEGGSLGIEGPLCSLPCLLLRQATPLPLYPLSAECCFQVPTVKGFLWHKHVALMAPGVVAVTLLQDHNFISHMAV